MPSRRPRLVLLLAALALAPAAFALDSAGVLAPLLATYRPVASVPDCPVGPRARDCVAVPAATPEAATRTVQRSLEAWLHRDVQRDGSSLSVLAGDTRYDVRIAPGRGGTPVARVELTPLRLAACPTAERLTALASRPSLTVAETREIGTDIACLGPDATTGSARTPLALAAAAGNEAAALALLRAGADPNAFDARLWTPLLHAARRGSRALIETLLRFGADPSYRAPDGASLATLAPLNPALHADAATLAWTGTLAATRLPPRPATVAAATVPATTAAAATVPAAAPADMAAPSTSATSTAGPDAAPVAADPRTGAVAGPVFVQALAAFVLLAVALARARWRRGAALTPARRRGPSEHASGDAAPRRRAGLATLELPPPLQR